MKIEITTPQGVKVDAVILKAGQGPVVPPVEPPAGEFYRHLHDYELGVRGFEMAGSQYRSPWNWRAQHGHPEVFWIQGGAPTPFTKAWQLLAFELNRPHLANNKFRVLFDDRRAFNNNTGFWSKIPPAYPDPHRRDYVNRIDDLNGDMPKWDKIRTCGGHTMRGVVRGQWFYPEYLAYDPGKPNDGAPTVEWLRERPWLYFHAVTGHERADGSQMIARFQQCGGEPVLIPFVAMAGSELRIPIQAVEAVDAIRDPYKIYIL